MWACNENSPKIPINVEKEIADLKTTAEKTAYLLKIYSSDQDIRDGRSSELILKYGHNSPEVLSFYSKMDSIDQLNLKRIELYLKTFGYPNFNSEKREAAITPWLVIQHSTDIEIRKGFFPILHKAFIDGNIDTDQFEMFLGRTYQMEYGVYPSAEGAYNPDEKIARLIKELNLE